MRDFTADELSNQSLFVTDSWNIILPQTPFSQYHIMFVIRRKSVTDFGDINDKEVKELRSLIQVITNSVEFKGTGLNGYNIFFNAGSERTGKHVLSFHAHLFLRIQNEEKSPYEMMNSGNYWSEIGSTRWNEQKTAIIALLNSVLKK